MLCSCLSLLLRLGCLLGLGRSRLLHRLRRLDAPLGDLDADAVLRGLEHDRRVVHLNDAADQTADGGEALALLEAVAHVFCLLFALVFRADDQEVEHRDHRNQQDNAIHSTSSFPKQKILIF